MNKETISALVDGEITQPQTVNHAIDALIHGDPALRRAWGRYYLIGDAIRADDSAYLDGKKSVSAVPQASLQWVSKRRFYLKPQTLTSGLALAASVAFLSILIWSPNMDHSAADSLAASSSISTTLTAETGQPHPSNPYLLAHQEATFNRDFITLTNDDQTVTH